MEKRVTVRVLAVQHKRLKTLARENGRLLDYITRSVIEAGLLELEAKGRKDAA